MRTRDIVLIVSGVAVLILVIAMPLFGGMMWGRGMMGYGPMDGYGGWGLELWGIAMMIVMVLFWALIIGGVVALVMWLVRAAGVPVGAAQPPAREDPLDILKQRYARGEITREQYEQMRQDLSR